MYQLKIVLILTIATVTASATIEPKDRSLIEFGAMIDAGTNHSFTDYLDYGRYCGYGGEGEPVDKLDKCCQVHDNCYGEADKNCWFGDTKTRMYSWNINNGIISCTNGEGTCEIGVCDCDKAAVECFAASEYNPAHWNIVK